MDASPEASRRQTRWWWIRHAPVTHLAGFIYGDSDPEADVTDLALFQSVARKLPQDAVWVITSLQRTEQTAEAIAHAGCDVPQPLVEPELRVRMASLTPAELTNINGRTGSLEEGKDADLILLDRELRVGRVWVGGVEIELR